MNTPDESSPHAPAPDGKSPEGRDAPLDSASIQWVIDAHGARRAQPPDVEGAPRSPIRRWLVGGAIAGAVAVALYFAVPEVEEFFSTVSTDDAFVAAHVTDVSPRIADLVTEVFVDHDDYVEPGTLLIKLDREPFEVALAQREAALDEARANLAETRANVKAQLARARGNWFRRKNAQEELRRQVAALRSRVAAVRARESSLKLAQLDHDRIGRLAAKGSATQAELDERVNRLDVARAGLTEAWALVQEARAALGLPPDRENPLDIPDDLEQQQSSIQSAVSDIANALAQVGIPFDLRQLSPEQSFEQWLRMDSDAGLEQALAGIIDRAPATHVAEASLAKAEKAWEDARLNLSYTDIRAEIAGYVERRSVHPGNHVRPGQTLLSIRPLAVWIDANFKETQLQYLRIGMPVDLHVDAYPERVFRGRVAGFSPATGAAAALLPPENATGNYIKVVQRLPVRIELAEPNPRQTPLFVGLSVVPAVRFKEPPTGPGAGERLRILSDPARSDAAHGPAARAAANGRHRGDGRKLVLHSAPPPAATRSPR